MAIHAGLRGCHRLHGPAVAVRQASQCARPVGDSDDVDPRHRWKEPFDGSVQFVANNTDDPTITAPISAEVVTNSYKATFDLHYKTKIPFGVYLHPIWVGPGVPPAIPSGTSKFAAVSAFLDYAMAQPNVWMVTHQQLIAYMKNPVSAAELGSQPYMQCPAPPANICNGAGNSTLFETCNLPNGTMRTCFGCPATYPDIANPTPARTTSRCVVPDTCDGLYWDPVACSCLPGGSYKDSSRPIQSKAQFDSWLNTTATAGGNRGNSNGAAAVGCSLFAIFLACLLI